MIQFRPLSRALLAALLTSALSPAAARATTQDPRPAPHADELGIAPGAQAITRIAGLGVYDGHLEGRGRSYRARFGPHGPVYTPALGRSVPDVLPVALRLQSIRRVGAPPITRDHLGTATVETGDLRVDYRYADGLVERYDVRWDGLEQSFVFPDLPPGSGDLVVCIDASTQLVASTDASGVAFHVAGQPGEAAVRFDHVVGIDAAGARAPGSIAWVDGRIEVRLPGAFVESAALPLVLDPLISTGRYGLNTSASDDHAPDVAYDATNDVYYVVWKRQFAARDSEIAGAFVNGRGNSRTGQMMFLTVTGPEEPSDPVVANIRARGWFVVAWSTAGNIFARCVGTDPATHVLGPIQSVVTSTRTSIRPDIGGSSSPTSTRAIIVWEDLFGRFVQGRSIDVDGRGQFNMGPIRPIASGGADSRPAIAKHGGPLDRWLIVWERDFAVTYIRGQVVDATMQWIGPLLVIANTALDSEEPDCDLSANGRNWIVTYQVGEAATALRDTACTRVYESHPRGLFLTGPEILVESNANDDELRPAVGFAGDSAIIAQADQYTTGARHLYLASVSPPDCDGCERRMVVHAVNGIDADYPEIATKVSGRGPGGEGALVVWQARDTTTGERDIYVVAWEPTADGRARDLGGSCAGAPWTHAFCPRVGNADFVHELCGAQPSQPAILLIGFQPANISCGGCSFVVDPRGAIAIATSTTSAGRGLYAMGIPASSALRGARLYTQWALVTPGAGCAAIPATLASGLELTIE